MTVIDHALHEAIKAADTLREQLRLITDDEQAITDTLEGEIDLTGLIAMAAMANATDAGLVDGLTTAIRALSDRKARIENRIDMRRAAILAAMSTAGLKRLETPCGTLTRKAVPPSALILEEAEVPAEFWKQQDPKLDKRAVLDALKVGREVPGAMLSNGNETLQIRT